ncbi:MAG: YbeD family protein [Acidiferrobacterales bacterium]
MNIVGRGNGGNGRTANASRGAFVFPCRFDIKAMGRHSVRFEALVQNIVSRHIDPQDLHAVTSRPSRGQKYIALTLTITAQSYSQLDAIYRDLSGCKDVLFAL